MHDLYLHAYINIKYIQKLYYYDQYSKTFFVKFVIYEIFAKYKQMHTHHAHMSSEL